MYTDNKKALLVTFLLPVIAFTVFGCGTLEPHKAYSGPELSLDEIAIIKPKQPSLLARALHPTNVQIGAIDGEEIKYGFFESGNLEVKPGKHSIAVRLTQSGGLYAPANVTPFVVLSFEAEAGHTYVVYGKMPGSIWIEDAETHEIVGGTMKP